MFSTSLLNAGVVYSNAAAAVKRAPVRGKEITLPTIDKFNALIARNACRPQSRFNELRGLGGGLVVHWLPYW